MTTESKANLKKWALLDIETTGVDGGSDDIIDIGFLAFEGTKLTQKFQSLVRTDLPISPFITHLTGITQGMVAKAPLWESVRENLRDLEDHYLIAHNAAFETMFLEQTLLDLDIKVRKPELGDSFGDSIPYLALTHPGRSKLGLESFIVDYQIADKEIHRGFEDSRDLLKVLLRTNFKLLENRRLRDFLLKELSKNKDYWFTNFLKLNEDDLKEISGQIDFELEFFSENKQEDIITPNESDITSNSFPFSGEGLKSIFQSEKNWHHSIPSYQYRKQQETMALKVGQSFKNNIHSLVQAPTGTGKSFAYLIPSLLFSKNENQKVLVTTGTKVLQRQLLDKDIPMARKVLGIKEEDIAVTKLVGTGNHLCRAKFEHEENLQKDLLNENVFESFFTSLYFKTLFFHNEISPYDEMVTAEEVPFSLKMSVANFKEENDNLRLDYKSCLGQQCPHVKNCSYFVGLEQARKSHIVVGNHALTFQWPQSFDRPDYIVFDEAHKIEDSATSAFSSICEVEKLSGFLKFEGQNSGIGALFYLMGLENDTRVQDLRKDIAESFKKAQDHLSVVGMLITKLAHALPRYSQEYWNEIRFLKSQLSSAETSLYNEINLIREIVDSIRIRLAPFYEKYEEKDWEHQEHGASAWSYFKAYYNQLEDYETHLSLFLADDEDYCRSLKYHESYGAEILITPVDVGKLVHEKLVEPSQSVVFTSATLGNMKGDKGVMNIEWLTGYLYTDPAKRFSQGFFLDPVFDYKKQAQVYFSDDLPPIYKQEYIDSVMLKLLPIIKEIKGKSLLLFSSYKRFEQAREILLDKLQGTIEVFYQGMGSRVVDDFKESKYAVLLGLESFGEGIDIPGENLQLLYIDKVPDLGHDLIYEQRKRFFDQHFGNSFSEYFMSTRARKLQQKLGRLIRATDDKGVIIVTDPRLGRWKSRTFQEFEKLLEPYQIQRISYEKAISSCKDFFHTKTY